MTKKELSLQVQIEQRKKQAKDRNISKKASMVARYLGNRNSLDGGNGISGNRYSFEGLDLKIVYESGQVSSSDGPAGFFSQEIHYKGKQVFYEGGGRIYTYIPGKWEKALDALQLEAMQAQKVLEEKNKEAAKKKQLEDEARERKRWGL